MIVSMSYSKYHAIKTYVDGIKFDSRREARRYQELKEKEDNGEIHNLQLQVPYILIPTQHGEDGKVKERKCVYKADFVYDDCSDDRAGSICNHDVLEISFAVTL